MEVPKYTRCRYDHCVYILKLQDEVLIYLLIYIDDMLIDSKNQEAIEKLTDSTWSKVWDKGHGRSKKYSRYGDMQRQTIGEVVLNSETIYENITKAFQHEWTIEACLHPSCSSFPKND